MLQHYKKTKTKNRKIKIACGLHIHLIHTICNSTTGENSKQTGAIFQVERS